ncbi:MAG: VOC family protein [Pseudomonadota bacterium]|nr:VOC family protein [Pseudomonadota bacterium]
MAIPKVKRIAHVVLYVRDPEASAQWYSDVLGMRISAKVPEGPYRGGVFLSFGVHDHDIAVFPAAAAGARGKEFEHIGLEVDCAGDLDQLRRLYGKMLEHNVRINEVLDHGVSIGIYFFDPDGHQLEVFCQLIAPEDGAAIAELGRNEGQANPIELTPLY